MKDNPSEYVNMPLFGGTHFFLYCSVNKYEETIREFDYIFLMSASLMFNLVSILVMTWRHNITPLGHVVRPSLKKT